MTKQPQANIQRILVHGKGDQANSGILQADPAEVKPYRQDSPRSPKRSILSDLNERPRRIKRTNSDISKKIEACCALHIALAREASNIVMAQEIMIHFGTKAITRFDRDNAGGALKCMRQYKTAELILQEVEKAHRSIRDLSRQLSKGTVRGRQCIQRLDQIKQGSKPKIEARFDDGDLLDELRNGVVECHILDLEVSLTSTEAA